MHIVDTINHKGHEAHEDFLQYSKKQIFLVILVYSKVSIYPNIISLN